MSKLAAKKSYSRMAQTGLTPAKVVLLAFLSLLLLFFLMVYLFLTLYTPTITMEDPNEEDIDEILKMYAPVVSDEHIPLTNEDGSPVSAYNPDISDSSDLARRKDCFTFLFLAKEKVGLNTDTMMLVTFDTKNDKISLAHLPRDTYIDNSYSLHKLNAVVGYGYSAAIRAGQTKDKALITGIKVLQDSIKKTFGVPVDKYIYIDIEGFKDLVDLVGGVEVNIPFYMKYTDPDQNLYINLPAGPTLLDGNKAEQFVRFRQGDEGYRSYPDDDIGRLAAQKEFLTALMKKLITMGFSQVQKLTGLGEKYIKTDINAMDMMFFAKEALQIKPENFRMHTMPGEGAYVGKAAYYTMYRKEVIEIVNKYYNPFEVEIPEDRFNVVEVARTYAYLVDIDGKTMGE